MKRIICLIFVTICGFSCSMVDTMRLAESELSYIAISKDRILSKDGLDEETQNLINEAKYRFMACVKDSENGLIVENSAEELCISSDLYDLFYIAFVSLPNAQMRSRELIRTKSSSIYDPIDSTGADMDFGYPIDTMDYSGPTGTRGNNRLVDMIASSIETLTSDLGWGTTSKFWHMWYFDVRENSYTLSTAEWCAVKDYAESEYKNHPTWASGEHAINFSFNSNPDLHFTYGTATAVFDNNGNCIGFRDTYDMNRMSGHRSDLDELITDFLSYLGNTEGGFEVRYGNF